MRLCKINMEFFEKNIGIIKEKNKYLGEKIDILNIDSNKMGITETTRNNRIPWIVKDARRWVLNSRIDSDEAACIYAERYDICMYGIYFIFGFSDGKHIREILKKCDDTNLIVVCEPSLEFFALICHYYDISDILADKRALIHFPELNSDLDAMLGKVIDYTRIKLVEFCILPGYDMLYHDLCMEYIDGVIERMRNEIVNKSTSLCFDRLIPQYTLYHMKNMIYHKNIEQLRQVLEYRDISSIPCIIVAAGPSLDKNICQLKGVQGKAFVIVVDAALRTVLKNGIRPDLVCTVDANAPDRFFDGLDLKNVVWAYTRTSRKYIAENYGKDVFYYGQFYRKWNEVLKEELGYAIPSFPSGGSVASEAFVLALYLGFKTIAFIGQDLAFTGGQSHTKEVVGTFGDNEKYIRSRHIVEVEGINGDILETDFQMWFYKQWFEKVIKMNRQDIKVIDSTEGGARIEGTVIQPLSKTIEQECDRYLDIYELEKQIPNAFTEKQQNELLKKLRYIKKEAIEFQTKINEIIKQQEKLLDQILNCVIKQQEVIQELKDIGKQNEIVENMSILDFVSMYAHEQEYEIGDNIYTEENIGPKEILQRSLVLYKGYQNGVKLLMEDIDEFIMKD